MKINFLKKLYLKNKWFASLFFIFLVFCSVNSYSQQFDSLRIGTKAFLTVNGEKVFTIGYSYDNDINHQTMYFDGTIWKNLSYDTTPTIHLFISQGIISDFSSSLYLTGHYHLWEHKNNQWLKHYIIDSLYHLRRFTGLLELPDSSLLLTANSRIFSNGHHIKTVGELIKFKDNQFTILESRTNLPGKVPVQEYYGKIRKLKSGGYFYSYLEEIGNSRNHNIKIVNQDGIEKQIPFWVNPNGYDSFYYRYSDYDFDSKGSMWYLSQNDYSENSFLGLLEVKPDGTQVIYNDSFGIVRSSYRSASMSIDNDDNIWFFYSENTKERIYKPNLYKLHADRKSLTVYSFETVKKYSKIYNGGDTSFGPNEWHHSFENLTWNEHNRSFFFGHGHFMIEFFLDKVPTSVKDIPIYPIHLYPNPVQSNNTIYIESRSFENVVNPLNVIIRDVSGATIREETILSNGTKLQINSQDLLSGTYFVSVLSNNKTILQTKFIKE